MYKFSFNDHIQLFRIRMINSKFWIILFTDLCIIILAHLLAYFIRYDQHPTVPYAMALKTIPLLILIKLPILYCFGLYRGMWRYTSMSDLFNISRATIVSSLALVMSLLYLTRFGGLSRAVFIMDGVFTFLFICMHRGIIRYFFENVSQFHHKRFWNGNEEGKIRLLLIGAGSAAEKVIREIKDNKDVKYKVVGLVDDDPQKQGLRIHGIPIIGSIDELDECINRSIAEELLITIASADGEQMRRIVEKCQKCEKKFKVLPSMGEIIKGKLSVSAIRDISYRDLLGREPVKLDQKEIGKFLSGKVVLVTGAGGSIGSELCRQIIKFDPKQLVLVDAGEENLYNIQMELHHDHTFTDYVPVLCKIQNKPLLDAVFTQYKPTVVFHAAAYKHVPLIEANPWEAVFNNVFATKSLLETSVAHNVARFVLVSTDKAVRPTNVMGASKRLTELLMLSYCSDQVDCKTTFMAVRFGNVLGSSGSVIPLFKKQIEKGGPVTITDPEITRYFMSIDEAAQLIIQAGAMGEGGEIFILKMGTPIKIVELANDLIKLMGLEQNKDIEIKYTGLRDGEKLYEELITEGEGIVPTIHQKIMVLKGDGTCLSSMTPLIKDLALKAGHFDTISLKKILHQLIPEYQPDNQAQVVIPNDTAKNLSVLYN